MERLIDREKLLTSLFENKTTLLKWCCVAVEQRNINGTIT